MRAAHDEPFVSQVIAGAEEHEEFIAHEIYDRPCQYVIAARMALDTFRHEKTETGSEKWGSFDTATEFLDRAIEELRRLIRGLQPIQLAAGGFPAAIAYLIEEIRAAGGPDMEFRHDIQPNQIPPQLQRAAFRIVQESLLTLAATVRANGYSWS